MGVSLWDGDSKHAVNIHFGKVNETRQALGYLDDLTLDNVLKSVLMVTLVKASANRTLRDVYHNLLDDLDCDKELTFAIMQQARARQFWRIPDHERPPDTPRTDRAPPCTSPAKPDIKYLHQGALAWTRAVQQIDASGCQGRGSRCLPLHLPR